MPRRCRSACLPALVVAVLVAPLAGCGGPAGVTDAPASVPPTSPAAPETGPAIAIPTVSVPSLPSLTAPGGAPATPRGSADPRGGAAQLPPDFPLPAGTTVRGGTSDGTELDATLTVPDSDEAVDFWREALPRAGYRIGDVQVFGGVGEIRFSGHGCGGDSQLALQGTAVTLQCNRT